MAVTAPQGVSISLNIGYVFVLFIAVEEYESSDGSDVISDNGVDTIHLQGEADDEADIGYLMDKLGFSNMNEGIYYLHNKRTFLIQVSFGNPRGPRYLNIRIFDILTPYGF